MIGVVSDERVGVLEERPEPVELTLAYGCVLIGGGIVRGHDGDIQKCRVVRTDVRKHILGFNIKNNVSHGSVSYCIFEISSGMEPDTS